MYACMCAVCLSVHVDQQLHCSSAVLDDGSSLLLSCAEVAGPQCSAHCSEYTPPTHTHTVLHTGIQRSHPREFSTVGGGQLDPVRHLLTKRRSYMLVSLHHSRWTDLILDRFTFPQSSVIMSLQSVLICLLKVIDHTKYLVTFGFC